MTELQWLIKILTQTKLAAPLKDIFIERLGEVEAQLTKSMYPPIGAIPRTNITVQSPSTQRLLEEQAINQIASPIMPPPMQRTMKTLDTQPLVQTGNGTKGPRKF